MFSLQNKEFIDHTYIHMKKARVSLTLTQFSEWYTIRVAVLVTLLCSQPWCDFLMLQNKPFFLLNLPLDGFSGL